MAFKKKIWVNVPDISNLPDIPEGQDALARFDAENMNRLEEGVESSATHVTDAHLHNKSTEGGAIGENADATSGGAVGYDAVASSGGAIGYKANTTTGAAVGSKAEAKNGGAAVGSSASATEGGAVGVSAEETGGGGAIGYDASAVSGGAVGKNAKAGRGFAGGYDASTLDSKGNAVDAIQLGTGQNTEAKSLQIYDKKLMKADGTIPDERMPTKAPAGHGLGELARGHYVDFIDMIHEGGGFYIVGNAADSPTGKETWLNLIQLTKTFAEGGGAETGVQIVADSLPANNSRGEFWVRTLFEGAPTTWRKLLHSGNYTKFVNTKIETGTYGGTGVNGAETPNTLTFSSKPKMVIIGGAKATMYSGIHTIIFPSKKYAVVVRAGEARELSVSWDNTTKTLSWYHSGANSADSQLNGSGVTYDYIGIIQEATV